MTTLGERFARALAAKDYVQVTGLLDPAVDFRGMTEPVLGGLDARPGGAGGPEVVVRGPRPHRGPGRAGDRGRRRPGAGRLALRRHHPDGSYLVEQLAFYSATDARISWMRVMCSGFRPG
jgi:hypothetical protein